MMYLQAMLIYYKVILYPHPKRLIDTKHYTQAYDNKLGTWNSTLIMLTWMCLIWHMIRIMHLRFVGVIRYIFHVLQIMLNKFTQHVFCCAEK